MQNKYLSALKTKYASFGLSKEALDRVALQRVKTIANEDEIDADIAASDTLMLIMKEMQSSADSQRNRAAQLQKDLDALKTTQTTDPTPSQNDNPYAKEISDLKDMMAAMMGRFAENEKKSRTEATLAKVHDLMKQKGCTNDFIRKTTLIGIEVGENDTAESLAEKYKSIYDENCKSAFGEGYTPPTGGNNGGGEMDHAEITRMLQERGLLPKSN
jgi:hypothetical protein